MDVRYRPMQAKDIRECVTHIAANPILAPRYGDAIKDLASAIARALGRDATAAVVFEEFSRGRAARFLGVGMAVFVSESFLRDAKSTPHFWVAPELARRIAHGASPLLSDSEVRDRNSTSGLDLVVWHDSSHPEDMTRAEVGTASMNAFDASYRGYRLREILAQADCVEHMWVMRNAGGLYFDPVKGRYGEFPGVNNGEFSDEPRNVGMTHELALTHGASWVGSLFLHPPPQFGFSRGEQRQLRLAVIGGTDEELADKLGISVFAVKKNWRVIYERVAATHPDLAPTGAQTEDRTQRRGKQKKQRLLDYLREHPEELRPVSRKLLVRQGPPILRS